MALGPGLLQLSQQLDAQKTQIAALRDRLHALARSSDPDKATLASSILHLADHVNQNIDAIKQVQSTLNTGR